MPISTTNLRARLSCDELHQLRWLLGLGLALLAYWTLFDLQIGSFTGVICAMLIVISCLAFPAWPGRLPAWTWRWAVPACILFMIGDFVLNIPDILPVLVRMISLLTLFRCLQYRRRREDLQLVLLCLFMIVLAGVLTLSLLFGVQILLFTVLAMALLFVINLLERESSRALTAEDWRNFSWRHFLGRLTHALNPRLLLMSGGLFTGLALLSTLIFVAIPRYSLPQAFSIAGLKGSSGFHDEITYGLHNSISLDNSVVLRVDVPKGVLFTAPPYWRMIVFDKYGENTFSTYEQLKNQPSGEKKASYTINDQHRLNDVARPPGVWTFYLEGNQSKYLPVLGPVAKLTFSSAQPFVGSESTEHMYYTDAPSANVLGYEVENMDYGSEIPASYNEMNKLADLTFAQAEAQPDSYPYTLLRDVPINDDDRKILLDKVNEIRAGNDHLTAAEFSERAIEYLKKNHLPANQLSVSLDPGKDRDKLVAWINSNSSGWCEYFAGSFVLLARTAGYPARVVAGFKGATYNTIEDYYVVRNASAHAWAEIFDGKDRWLREDPTPVIQLFASSTALPSGAQTPAPGPPGSGASNGVTILAEQGWGARVDSLRMLWYRRVINFDQSDQQEFANKISDLWTGTADAVKLWFVSFWKSIVDWLTAPLSLGHLLVIVPLLIACVLGLSLRFSLHNWWLLSSGSGFFALFSRQAPVRRDAGRWLVRFLPVWRVRAPLLAGDERLEWDRVRFNLLALRYGPLDNLPPDPAGICRRARELLHQARRQRKADL